MAFLRRREPQVALNAKNSDYAYSKTKRVIDTVAAFSLLLLTLPLLMPALVINIFVTRGKPIYVQKRAKGLSDEFSLLKFRTMRLARPGEMWSPRTELEDVRVTAYGKILRITYIDELPQLINVLRGDMSMIGPRPETLETTTEIVNTNPRFSERMSVRPGITGAAQIFFRKPESDQDLWRRFYYDRLYIRHCSFWFDLKIAVLTVWHIIRHRGA